MGVSKNRGGPPKWMVKIMEKPLLKLMIRGKTHYFRKHPIEVGSLSHDLPRFYTSHDLPK